MEIKKSSPIRMRNYGRIVQDMIEYIAGIEDAEEKYISLCYLASCMRQKNSIWNKDQDTSIEKVREDIERISGGRLDCSAVIFDTLPLAGGNGMNNKSKNKSVGR